MDSESVCVCVCVLLKHSSLLLWSCFSVERHKNTKSSDPPEGSRDASHQRKAQAWQCGRERTGLSYSAFEPLCIETQTNLVIMTSVMLHEQFVASVNLYVSPISQQHAKIQILRNF